MQKREREGEEDVAPDLKILQCKLWKYLCMCLTSHTQMLFLNTAKVLSLHIPTKQGVATGLSLHNRTFPLNKRVLKLRCLYDRKKEVK